MTLPDTLARLESYYDAVPRRRAGTEQIGPFTLFVARLGWPYYARPTLEGSVRPGAHGFTADDVEAVVARQQSLGVPVAFEWVDETTPGLIEPLAQAGLHIERCPLLVLEGEATGTTSGARMLGPDDLGELALSRAAVSVGFDAGGTGIGPEGLAGRDAQLGEGFSRIDPETAAALAEGRLRAAACYASDEPDAGPVGGGNHTPIGDVSEIAAVAVLPAYRRRGLAAAMSVLLARDALNRGVGLVFCSAQSDDVARVYERVGFRRAATACIASAPSA